MKRMKKGLALLLAAVVMVICMPAVPAAAQAVALPAFVQKYAVFYENRANNGIYDLTVKNVQKGYILKWHITGKGKRYASFETKKTIAQAAGSVTNRLTINSYGDDAYAAAERIRITVYVYTANWKRVNSLTFAGRLQSKAKTIDLDASGVTDMPYLTVGTAYELRAFMTPSNTTSKIYWQVTDAAGQDRSAQITETGVWTPLEEGTYTITAMAKNTPAGAALCAKSITAIVGPYMESISQTAADGISVTFNMATHYKETDFTVKSGEASVVVKKVKYAEDGKTAFLTMASNFIDGRTYEVSCAGDSREFAASVGKPAELLILTETAQVEKYTTINYALLDANGVDVTKTVDGTFLYTANVNNGFLDKQTNCLFMTTVGNTAMVTLSYTSPDGTINLVNTKKITCVVQQAEIAADTRFTLTDSVQEPSFKENDVRVIAADDTMYAHFRGLNEEGAAITYDSVTYSSSDPDRLIISPDGKLTPIKAGEVTIVVTAKQGSESVPYSYPIMISEARRLSALRLGETTVTMSNTSQAKYRKEIPVTAFDQYGDSYALQGENGTVTSETGQTVLAVYDEINNKIVIQTQGAQVGTYSYTLTVMASGVSTMQKFTVVVVAPIVNGAVSYRAEASQETMELSVNADAPTGQSIEVRLAEYRGGVFFGYKYFISAQIQKGSAYYDSSDLLTAKSGSDIRLAGSDVLTLSPVTIVPGTVETGGIGTCRKAEPGVYKVTLMYADGSNGYKTESIDLTLTAEKNVPDYALRSLTTSATAVNALQMANDCIYIAGGTITDCTAAGTNLTGSDIPLVSGQQLHINTVTVRMVVALASGQSVYVTHVVTVDKTFTNK